MIPLTQRSARHISIRENAAESDFPTTFVVQTPNGDEAAVPAFAASYTKGLPHDAFGEVAPAAYNQLLAALDSENPADFEQIELGGERKLTNPQAGLAFDLEGWDSHAVRSDPAPTFASPEEAGEMAELYWMALLRDVPFIDWGRDGGPNTTTEAAASLNGYSDFRGPKAGGQVTVDTLFRGFAPGDLVGPYVSQFLLMGSQGLLAGPGAQDSAEVHEGYIQYGTLRIDQRQRTASPGVDYLTRFSDEGASPKRLNWLDVQRGRVRFQGIVDVTAVGANSFVPGRLFIRSLRDLANWVHYDQLYEAYLNAALLMLSLGVPFNPGNPYLGSRTQVGFGTFGGPHVLSLVTEVATRALKAVWYQKWGVHRRLRPEAFGGRVHLNQTDVRSYPINAELSDDAELLDRVRAYNQLQNNGDPAPSYLLPMAFPEGSPTHPSYGAGHATVAGACVTILKAFFDESFPLTRRPLAAKRDGSALVLVDEVELTVGGELNKLAANIALARNAAGVHWRSDYTASLRLGEEIAIRILKDQKETYNEGSALTFTRFDGESITI